MSGPGPSWETQSSGLRPSPWLSGTALLGLSVLFGLILLRLAALSVSVDPSLPTQAPMLPPSWSHLLGTDELGRDLLGRMIVAVEAFFVPGFFACLLCILLGLPAGAAVGYWPRARWTPFLHGALTMLGAWPRLVVVVLVVAIFTASVTDPAAWAGLRLYLLAGLVGLAHVPLLANALMEKVRHFQREQFVEAARAHGVTEWRILGWHILWANCRYLLLRQMCSLFGSFLLVETSLSYLGHYGVPIPRPSWGNILAGVKFNVIHTRTLLQPEAWTPTGLMDAVGLAIQDGGLVALAAPTLAIGISVAGIHALALHFQRMDAAG